MSGMNQLPRSLLSPLIALLVGCVLAGALASPALRAQESEPPDSSKPTFYLSGTSSLTGQISNRSGTSQGTPRNLGRWYFRPTVWAWQVPVAVDAFFATEQDSTRQRISSMSVSVDYNRLISTVVRRIYDKLFEVEEVESMRGAVDSARATVDAVRDTVERTLETARTLADTLRSFVDPERLKAGAVAEGGKVLEELGVASAAERFFLGFPTLALGVTYPRYTELTMNGVAVNGGSVEWNPGMFYVAASVGTTQRAILIPGRFETDVPVTSFSRTLYAARLGYGRKQGERFIVTGLYARDNENSLNVDSVTGRPRSPRENIVVGVDMSVPVITNTWTVGGEIVGSVLKGDVEAPTVGSSEIPRFIRTTLDPNISSVIDYAANVKTDLRLRSTDTRLGLGMKFIGPAFFTLGSPALRSDLLRYEGQIEQGFFTRQLRLRGRYQHETDNTFPQFKTSTTTLTSYTIGADVSVPKWPRLSVTWSPTEQTYRDSSFGIDIDNRTSVLNANANYGWKLLDLDASTYADFSMQRAQQQDEPKGTGVSTVSLGQQVTLKIPVTVGVAGRLSILDNTSGTGSRVGGDLNVGWTLFETWSSSAGVTLERETGVGNNLIFSLSTSIPVGFFGTLTLDAQHTIYKSIATSADSFKDYVLTAVLTTQW